MKTLNCEMLCAVALLVSAGAVQAQTPELEPGVQTSSSAAPAAASLEPTAPATAAPTPATHAPAPPAKAAPAAKSATPAIAAHAGAPDRVDLGTTTVSGNRELPKVMYVVPWRKPELGEFAGRPPNSLLDEALTPVDRDVFKRQNRYYDALQGQAGAAKSQPEAPAATSAAPTAGVEK